MNRGAWWATVHVVAKVRHNQAQQQQSWYCADEMCRWPAVFFTLVTTEVKYY